MNKSGQIVGVTFSHGVRRAFIWQRGRTTDLGAVDGSGQDPVLINNRGEVVLNTRDGHAVLWNAGRRTDLGALAPNGTTSAKAINDEGDIVGWSTTPAGRRHAFVWRTGKMTDIGKWGWRVSSAVACNAKGATIGWRLLRGSQHILQPPLHAILWQARTEIDLGNLGGKGSDPVAMNNRGQIVGSSNTRGSWDGLWHAFLWQNGTMLDLGVPDGMTSSWATAINARGEVVGTGGSQLLDAYYSDHQRAFRWADGRLMVLPLPNGMVQSVAVGINNQGQIIFDSFKSDYEAASAHAAVWDDGRLVDLGGGTAATAINEHGDVVGTVDRAGGNPHVALWALHAR